MPLIPEEPLQGVAFLYRTKEEAAQNAKIGGTCFLFHKSAPKASKALGQTAYVPYFISNSHVVWEGAAPVVRLNKRDGKAKVIDYDCLDWVLHPEDDLAAACAFRLVFPKEDEIKGVPDWYLITEDKVKDWKIGIGDEVAMFGRFINHQGKGNRIKPALRLGSISMMPEPISNSATKREQLSYAVEMRSRTGFSGAPVAMYRTPATTLIDLPKALQNVHGLLGVCWGMVLDEDGENTWLNGVVPAWKILDLMNDPKLKEPFDEWEARAERDGVERSDDGVLTLSEALPTKGENPQHREDFSRLLDAAARGSKPSPRKA